MTSSCLWTLWMMLFRDTALTGGLVADMLSQSVLQLQLELSWNSLYALLFIWNPAVWGLFLSEYLSACTSRCRTALFTVFHNYAGVLSQCIRNVGQCRCSCIDTVAHSWSSVLGMLDTPFTCPHGCHYVSFIWLSVGFYGSILLWHGIRYCKSRLWQGQCSLK